MRVPHNQRALRLRRKRVEDGVDRVRPFCLQATILLEAIPDAVFGVNRVVDLHDDEVLAVVVVQRPLLLGCAAAAGNRVPLGGAGNGFRMRQADRP